VLRRPARLHCAYPVWSSRSLVKLVNDSGLEVRHLAVVPVSTFDADTAEALTYAATVAPSVLAVHIRHFADAERIEQAWAKQAMLSPLVVVDATDGDCALAFRQALDVVGRTQGLDQITVVLPRIRQDSDWRHTLTSGSSVTVQRLPRRGEEAR
jgi:hypothetical protein